MVSDPMARDDRDVPDEELVVTFMDDLRARIAALEAENRALRGFVAAADKLSSYEQSYPEGLNPLVVLEELDRLQGQFVAIRNRLAADHGLPLPEVER